ncbi:MAG: DUF2306 domain-containing protein [Acidobacteriota bacterium]
MTEAQLAVLRRLVFSLALGVAAYAAVAYSVLPLGSTVHPDMRVAFNSHQLGIYSHIFASIFALALGPFQFSQRLRTRHPHLHRWSGRLYLGVGVLVGGVAGLYMAQFAFGGTPSQWGFSLLAIFWLASGWRAFSAIRRGDVTAHQRWMVRNYALTLAAVTIRLYLPLGGLLGVPFEITYPAVTWLCWLPNLAIAEWWLARGGGPVTISKDH